MIRRLADALIGAVSPTLAKSGARAFALGWLVLLALVALRLSGARGDATDWILALAVGFALILTGAALIMLDALRAGFGALDAFFQAALARSARRNEAPPRPAPEAPQSSKSGILGDRPFTLHADGGVTVETLLGRRRFGSLREAREFIGA